MNNPLRGMLEDDNGGASSNRFVFVFGSSIIILVWAILCIRSKSFMKISFSDMSILLLLIGSKFGGKALEVIEAIKKPGIENRA